jgi:hypothetical protein
MRAREWARLDYCEQDRLIGEAADGFRREANLYRETPDERRDAVREGPAALERELGRWLTPSCDCRRSADCDHGFPPSFVRELRASANVKRLRRYAVMEHAG